MKLIVTYQIDFKDKLKTSDSLRYQLAHCLITTVKEKLPESISNEKRNTIVTSNELSFNPIK